MPWERIAKTAAYVTTIIGSGTAIILTGRRLVKAAKLIRTEEDCVRSQEVCFQKNIKPIQEKLAAMDAARTKAREEALTRDKKQDERWEQILYFMGEVKGKLEEKTR